MESSGAFIESSPLFLCPVLLNPEIVSVTCGPTGDTHQAEFADLCILTLRMWNVTDGLQARGLIGFLNMAANVGHKTVLQGQLGCE